ncbi:hypothetical protein [Spirosoma spitsbergense]|uniref:hypothetical protein n=1 Tax=Spirosoma spitsbergense TaxID=431554 RepID=UPI000361822A|nr:hypothetical protein [Spirosoma spitsbergense]
MKNKLLLFSIASLFFACGRTEKTSDTTGKTADTSTDSAMTAAPPAPKNCQSVINADKLGKADVYQESAKSISVSITMEQDASTTPTASDCYFNNKATVLAAKKSGSQVFKRTLQKDDLALFTNDDAYIEKAVLQQVTYKPTFNGQRYVTLTMRLLQPDTKKTMTYTVFMNYFGEMVKVK